MAMKEEKRFTALREKMVETQIASRGVKDKNVLKALKKVPRHLFVKPGQYLSAYEDYPLSIGLAQTISQPYIVALMTELLEISSGDKVLEVGTGSGYQTAILAEIAKEVYTIEFLKELSEKSKKLLINLGYKNICFKTGNGYEGWPEFAPFNKIIVTAAPERIPETLKEQLADGGKMVLPVGAPGFNQSLIKLTKSGKNFIQEEICGVSFVPMVKNSF